MGTTQTQLWYICTNLRRFWSVLVFILPINQPFVDQTNKNPEVSDIVCTLGILLTEIYHVTVQFERFNYDLLIGVESHFIFFICLRVSVLSAFFYQKSHTVRERFEQTVVKLTGSTSYFWNSVEIGERVVHKTFYNHVSCLKAQNLTWRWIIGFIFVRQPFCSF